MSASETANNLRKIRFGISHKYCVSVCVFLVFRLFHVFDCFAVVMVVARVFDILLTQFYMCMELFLFFMVNATVFARQINICICVCVWFIFSPFRSDLYFGA